MDILRQTRPTGHCPGLLDYVRLLSPTRERVPTEEDHREVPLESLRPSDIGEGFLEGRLTGRQAWTERKKLRKKATVQGFKYPWTRARLDIVRSYWTFSRRAELCPIRTLCPARSAELRFSENF
jgi:hypothetical protein